MDVQLIAETIGAIAILATALVAWQRVSLERKKATQAVAEMKSMAEGLSFADFLQDWQGVAAELGQLISGTEIDRILILRAWNGSLDPRWTTAVYQMREVGYEPVQYIHTSLDSDYVHRLRDAIQSGNVYFVVSDLNDSLIKSIYEAEGVTASYWAHIQTEKAAKDGTVSMAYMSFSTQSNDGIDPVTQTKCLLIADRLRGLANSFNTEEPNAAT